MPALCAGVAFPSPYSCFAPSSAWWCRGMRIVANPVPISVIAIWWPLNTSLFTPGLAGGLPHCPASSHPGGWHGGGPPGCWLDARFTSGDSSLSLRRLEAGGSRSQPGGAGGEVAQGRIIWPPSTLMICPVIKLAASESRKRAACPMSSGVPRRCRGMDWMIWSM